MPEAGGVPPADRSRLGPRGFPQVHRARPVRHEIGQLADATTRRTRDRSPDATAVVPTRARDHVRRHLHQEIPGSPDQGCRHHGRPGWERPRRPHISARLPMIREPESLTIGPQTGPARRRRRGTRRGQPGPCTINGAGRSAMKRTRIRRPRVRSEHCWLEELTPDPRDPDVVRAKALTRTVRSRQAPENDRPGRKARTAGRPDGDPRGQNGQRRTGTCGAVICSGPSAADGD